MIRLEILDELHARLEAIQRGDIVRAGSSETFANTVRRVFEVPKTITSLADHELPAIFILLDEPTTYEPGSTGHCYDAIWTVVLGLAVRDHKRVGAEESQVPRLLESLYRDVQLAIHDDPFQPDPSFCSRADVNWSLDGWTIDYYDTELGLGFLSLSISYQEVMAPAD